MQGSARIDELRQKFHENPRRYFAPLANEYRKAGDPEQAIAICRAHLAQQPGHMSGHVVYGQALYDAQRIDESRTVFEKALSLDPDNAVVLRHLGDIARQRGDSGEAKHWYARALDADPHDAEVAAYVAELTEPLTAPAEQSGIGEGVGDTVTAEDVVIEASLRSAEPPDSDSLQSASSTGAQPITSEAIPSDAIGAEGIASETIASETNAS
ncbi:MAG TPA: tetratricopeptide repeat protein, partial [Gemmatimonadaceae bacterium]|nr:tetratricopeptide repeat protein [Gemmatimonadaceae bacterium]